jgi:predicted Zn-dependent protease
VSDAARVQAQVGASLVVFTAGLAKEKKKDPNKDPEEIGNRDVGKGVNFYSLEREIALGKQMAQEVERQAKIINDPVIAEFDTDEVNAFALPGGFFFVNSGLILRTDKEAELAGVMAHEIAHVAARHGTRQATRGELINYATLPLIFAGGWTGYAIYEAASAAIPLGFLKFSRVFESEADMLGLQYMYKAGYDPTSFVDFFEKVETLEKTKPGTLSKVFSSHPMTDDRIKAAQQNIQQNLEARPEYVLDTSEFQEVKKRLSMLENHRKPASTQDDRPTLRRSPGNGSAPDTDPDGKASKPDQDERPTLKRRD